jgi:hypothetical protein
MSDYRKLISVDREKEIHTAVGQYILELAARDPLASLKDVLVYFLSWPFLQTDFERMVAAAMADFFIEGLTKRFHANTNYDEKN